MSPQVRISASPDTLQTDAAGVIEIGMPALEQKLREASGAERRLLLSFILAHEAWHVHQRTESDAPAVASMNESERRLRECAADAMAGYFVVKATGGSLFENPAGLESVRRLVWDMVSTEGFHPKNHQRDAALTLGFRLAMIEMWQQRPNLDDLERAALAQMRKMSGWNGTDQPATIAQFLCRQISQYDDGSARMVQVTDASHEFHPTLEFPFVHYALSFRNRGKRAVQVIYTPKVMLGVGICSGPRLPDDQFQAYQLFSAETHIFVIPPGGTHHLMGMLPWLPTSDRCPRIDYQPRSPRTMISYHFVDGVQQAPTCMARPAKLADSIDQAFAYGLMRIANEADSQFALVRGAPIATYDRTLYDANISLPGVKDLYVSVSRNGASYVSGHLYEGPDAAKAGAVFRELRNRLVRVCPLTVGDWEERLDEDGSSELEIKRFTDTSMVRAYMREMKPKEFVVNLTIDRVQDDTQ